MEPEQNSQNQQSDDEPLDENIDFVIMAMAKREHLSFEELNLFRVKDFFKFSKKYGDTFDTKKNKKKARRRATQADIDKFYD
jgi:hypothetical protein